ncbi:MAG: hypothetical protein JWR21_3697 [Herminiimonas sp.]|nr:hypothetical protein [Herminiimonas sp.]
MSCNRGLTSFAVRRGGTACSGTIQKRATVRFSGLWRMFPAVAGRVPRRCPYRLGLAVVGGQELQLVPREAVHDGVGRRAAEQWNVRIGLADRGIALRVFQAQRNRSCLVPDHETVFLSRLRNNLGDWVKAERIDVNVRIEAEAAAFRNTVRRIVRVVAVGTVGRPRIDRPCFKVDQRNANGMPDLAAAEFLRGDLSAKERQACCGRAIRIGPDALSARRVLHLPPPTSFPLAIHLASDPELPEGIGRGLVNGHLGIGAVGRYRMGWDRHRRPLRHQTGIGVALVLAVIEPDLYGWRAGLGDVDRARVGGRIDRDVVVVGGLLAQELGHIVRRFRMQRRVGRDWLVPKARRREHGIGEKGIDGRRGGRSKSRRRRGRTLYLAGVFADLGNAGCRVAEGFVIADDRASRCSVGVAVVGAVADLANTGEGTDCAHRGSRPLRRANRPRCRSRSGVRRLARVLGEASYCVEAYRVHGFLGDRSRILRRAASAARCEQYRKGGGRNHAAKGSLFYKIVHMTIFKKRSNVGQICLCESLRVLRNGNSSRTNEPRRILSNEKPQIAGEVDEFAANTMALLFCMAVVPPWAEWHGHEAARRPFSDLYRAEESTDIRPKSSAKPKAVWSNGGPYAFREQAR